MPSPFPVPLWPALLAGIAIFMLPAVAFADDDDGTDGLNDVVVSATRTPTPAYAVGSSVTVIDQPTLERLQTVQVLDALARVPGVAISRAGGFGATSLVRLRGGDPGEVKVLVDGVEVNDPASTDNSFDFAGLTTTGIERIEVLRGPQSALYGNDAMSGVISITTQRPQPGLSGTALVEGGSYGTQRAQAGVAYGGTNVEGALNASEIRSDGFPRQATSTGDDATLGRTLDGHVRAQLSDDLAIEATGGWSYLNGAYDPSPATLQRRDLHGRVAVDYTIPSLRWTQTLALSGARTWRGYDEPDGYYRYSSYDGGRWALDYQSSLGLRRDDTLTFGAGTKTEDVATSTTVGDFTSAGPASSMRTDGGFVQYQADVGGGVYLTAGGRVDGNTLFGSHGTYRLAASWVANEALRLRASFGTGAKAPSLFQLLDPYYGNRSLKVETSEGADIGATLTVLGGRLVVDGDLFHNDFRNLIAFTDAYANVAKAMTQGAELAVTVKPVAALTLAASYTYLDSRDETTGLVLPRRPRHTANVSADVDLGGGTKVGADVRAVADQLDSSYSTAQTRGYAVLGLRASQDLPWWGLTLFGRVENLTDRRYQEVLGYNTPGRSYYGGLSAKF